MTSHEPKPANQEAQDANFDIEHEQLMLEKRRLAGLSVLGHFAEESMRTLGARTAQRQASYYESQLMQVKGSEAAIDYRFGYEKMISLRDDEHSLASSHLVMAVKDYGFFRQEQVISANLNNGDLVVEVAGDNEDKDKAQSLVSDFMRFHEEYSPLRSPESAERNRAGRAEEIPLTDPALPGVTFSAPSQPLTKRPLNPKKLLPGKVVSLRGQSPAVLIGAETFRRALVVTSALNSKSSRNLETQNTQPVDEYHRLLQLPIGELRRMQKNLLLETGKHATALRRVGLLPEVITARKPNVFLKQVKLELARTNTPERKKIADELKKLLLVAHMPDQGPEIIKVRRLPKSVAKGQMTIGS